MVQAAGWLAAGTDAHHGAKCLVGHAAHSACRPDGDQVGPLVISAILRRPLSLRLAAARPKQPF